MERDKRRTLGQDGSVLIIALLIMVLLTVVGLSVTATTDTDIQIAKNDQFHKTAFFNADSGISTTPKLISLCINPDLNYTFNGTLTSNFCNEVIGYDPHDDAPDLEFTLGGSNNVSVDVNRTGQHNIAGGGVEFASGAEGIGVGSGGGVAVLYYMDSFGTGPNSSESNVGAVYRKVVGF